MVHLGEDVAGGGFGGDVVAGGEDVAGVDADADAVVVVDAAAHRGEVVEGAAEAGALAGGGFQADGHLAVFFLVKDEVHGVDDAGDAAGFAGAAVGTGVGDEVGDAELVATAHFFTKGGDAFFPQDGVGGGEVDEVGVVGDDFLEAEAFGVGAEGGDGGFGEGFGGPLLLVFGGEWSCYGFKTPRLRRLGKDLHSIDLQPFRGKKSVVHAPSDREVRSEHLRNNTLVGAMNTIKRERNCQLAPPGDHCFCPRG